MFPLPSTSLPPQRIKRRQVKNACTNCQKSCKKCDDARPCLRCVKYGMQEACVSSQRKERKKGVKRGPYKKREQKSTLHLSDSSSQQGPHLQHTVSAVATAPPVLPSYMPIGLPAAFYSPQPPKNGETPTFYHPYFISQLPSPTLQSPHNGQDGCNPNHPSPGSYYSAALVAQFSPNIYSQYPVPRPGVQTLHQNVHYALYAPPPTCTKQPSDHDPNHINHEGSLHGSG